MREQVSQTGNSGYILSCGYFHGDNGAGLRANHQTGWTGLVARTLELFSRLSPENALKTSRTELLGRMTRERVAVEESEARISTRTGGS